MATYHFYSGEIPHLPKGTPLKLGTAVMTGQTSAEKHFGTLTTLEIDLLTIASSIFAVDRGDKRGEREDYARSLTLHIPVVNIGRLQPLIPTIESALRNLSNDLWTISLYQAEGNVTQVSPFSQADGQVLLFSGGLDSLAAAIEFSTGPTDLALVSHVTKNRQTITAQQNLYEALVQKGRPLKHYSYFVSSKNTGLFQHDLENSQRTRSFLFLTIAALTAYRLGRRKLIMIAENGQMAIHLSLTPARMAAFSTHTAHPDVLTEMQQYLKGALGVELDIYNPYTHKTKKEVVKPIINFAPELVAISNSCWKSARIPSGATHCGECIPCFIRRIAIESYGPDPTAYGRDLFSAKFRTLPPDDEGRRNLADLAEFTLNFEGLDDMAIYEEWPELYSVNIDAPKVISMYRRAAKETRALLSKYPIGAEVLA